VSFQFDLLAGIGFLGQGLFASRIILQWIASEKAGRSIVPRGYWSVSLVAAGLVLAYAVGRHNIVYALSVLPGALVAWRNMRLRRGRRRRELLPWAVALLALIAWAAYRQLLDEKYVGPPVWAAVGITGSILWSLRNLLQWWISERLGQSTLPVSFWVLSLVGSLLLVLYAITRADLVMIIGYGFGCVPYVRNLRLLLFPPARGDPQALGKA